MTQTHVDLWRVDDALRWATGQLAETSEPVLASRILLAHVLHGTATDLFVHPERRLTSPEEDDYRRLIARRAQHEPVAYLVGSRAFLDFDLMVSPDVLIPRPETEALVEHALAAALRGSHPRIVDVGTGSGAIAIGIAARAPHADVYAIDRSPAALDIARANARRCQVARRITFLQGNLLTPLPVRADVVVANLPYVSEAEYAALPPEIRLYEPRSALVAGSDGLDAIRALLDTAHDKLAARARILLEIGATQGAAARSLARAAYPGAQIALYPDDAGHDRIVRIDLPGAPRDIRPG
ncbi:MAG: peptide chain release factor N(5)-glutamine methyltransferase [Anaerolineae bacterium]|nr:peptide chain release factor N(5)-glutamine methyltransferase [Anaerolineae bacterium]